MKPLRLTIPEGKSGDWAIERFTVSDEEAELESLRAIIGGHGRGCPAGTFTRLMYGGNVIMSDTPDELSDAWGFRRLARGKVLISGLGMGAVLQQVLDKPNVEYITVLELSGDVIRLVAPTMLDAFRGRLTVIQADALTWKPPQGCRWDVAWHDIWPTICAGNWDTMKRLHRKYARRCPLQLSWCRREVQRLVWRDKQEEKMRSYFRQARASVTA